MKHRCSQTQFKAVAAWCWDTERSFREGAWRCPPRCPGSLPPLMAQLAAVQSLSTVCAFCLFSCKWKSSSDFFCENRYYCKSSANWSGIKWTFKKWGIPVYLTPLSMRAFWIRCSQWISCKSKWRHYSSRKYNRLKICSSGSLCIKLTQMFWKLFL